MGRQAPRPLPRFATLYERRAAREPWTLSARLRRLYDGDLAWPRLPDRPYVVANFVQTLDGVVSYAIPGSSGGGEISGFDRADQFLMGLLRSCADAVMVASGTFHADAGHVRIPSFIFPEAKALFRGFRKRSGKSSEPLNVIVTGSGRVDLSEPTFHTAGLETLIVTNSKGRRRLEADHGRGLAVTRVRVAGAGSDVTPGAVLDLLRREFGVRLLLHEGGPWLLAAFLGAGRVDELFLTVAPQIAGREAGSPRPGLVEGLAFTPKTAPWFRLISAKRAGDHLYLRLATQSAGAGRRSPGRSEKRTRRGLSGRR